MARRRSRSLWRTPWRRRTWTRAEEKLIGGVVAGVLLIGTAVWLIENFWPLLLLLGVSGVAWAVYQRHEREQRIRALSTAEIDTMSGAEFERYLVRLLTFHGYAVTHTGAAGDQGCDLLLVKDGCRVACQAKRYRKRVTNDAVAEAVASKAYHACDEAMVITSSDFTKSARDLAKANNCRLIDREELAGMISRFQATTASAREAKPHVA